MKSFWICILLFESIALASQISENFELLDHRSRISNLGAHQLVGNEIFYVSHNDIQPMTTLNVCNDKNEIISLFESYFSSRSKKIITSDSTFSLFIFDLFDYDIGLPGVYIFNYSPQSYSIDTLLTYQNIHTNFSEYVFDITLDSLNNYYIKDLDGIGYVSAGEVVNSFNIPGSFKVYTCPNSKIYAYSLNQLNHFNGSGLDTVLSLSHNIIDLRQNGLNNFLLTTDSLYQYDADFSEVLNQWAMPDNIRSFDQFAVIDSSAFVLSSSTEKFELLALEKNGEVRSLYSSPQTESETVTGFTALDGNRFLLNGIKLTGNVCRNIFFRNHSFLEPTDYNRVDVRIEEFELIQSGTDTSYTYITPDEDTIHYLDIYYDYSIIAQNQHSDSVRVFSFYGNDFFSRIGPDPHFVVRINQPIGPFDTLDISATITVSPQALSPFIIALPGADYRFNLSTYNVIMSDITTAVENIIPQVNLLVYPNPATNWLTLTSHNLIESVYIFDSCGKLVISDKIYSPHAMINISEFSPGIYFGVCSQKNQPVNSNFKFIKHP